MLALDTISHRDEEQHSPEGKTAPLVIYSLTLVNHISESRLLSRAS